MQTITAAAAIKLADQLNQARFTKKACAPLTAEYPNLTIADAYLIQNEVVKVLLAAPDEKVVGYKLGLTSKAMQQMLNVDSPDFAPVLASHVNQNHAIVPRDEFIDPKIEAEIALKIGTELSGPNCTVAEVSSALIGAQAALEIVDSRIANWQIKLADTVADMASSGAIVLGDEWVPVTDFDLKLTGMTFYINDELVATGAGAAALGDPLAAVAWLTNLLYEFGVTLPAGSILMTGALHAAVPFQKNDKLLARFDRLGEVALQIS